MGKGRPRTRGIFRNDTAGNEHGAGKQSDFAGDAGGSRSRRCGRGLTQAIPGWLGGMILLFEIMAPPPYFSQVFILKGVKVLCFDTLLQVFILKVLICTKIVQSQGNWKRMLPRDQR